MDYKDILQRYYAGTTTLDEERALREYLLGQYPDLTKEERVAHAMVNHTTELRRQSVNVRMHVGSPRRVWAFMSVCAVCVVMIICGIKLTQPTIYGYHNGMPITSFEEAKVYGEQMFAELAVADYPAENRDLLRDMFKFE